MKRALLLVSLLFLLMYATGCTSGSADGKSDGASHVKREGVAVQQKKEIPLLLTFSRHNDGKTLSIAELATSGLWDLQTGDIVVEKKLQPLGEFDDDPRFIAGNSTDRPVNEDGTMRAYFDGVQRAAINGGYFERGTIVIEFRKANDKATKLTLRPPQPNDASGPRPYLLSGTPKNFILLAAYDQPSKSGAVEGNLLLGEHNGLTMQWRTVQGPCPSFMADYMPDAVRIRDKIYIDGKSGYTAKVIDLACEPLKLADYTPVNGLIDEVKDTLDTPEIPPLTLTSYKDILLVSVGWNSGIWVWALQNDKCIAKACLDVSEKTLTSYKGDKVAGKERFSERPSGIRLPN